MRLVLAVTRFQIVSMTAAGCGRTAPIPLLLFGENFDHLEVGPGPALIYGGPLRLQKFSLSGGE